MSQQEIQDDPQENQWYVDLHVHTTASHDGIGTPIQMIETAISLNLDAIAITDHNSVAGAAIATEYAEDHKSSLVIIPGIEVSSSQGHILALGVVDSIDKGLSLEETVRIIHEQGGLAIPSHPFDRLRSGCGKNIDSIASEIDAVETLNGGSMTPWANKKAEEWARRNQVPMVGGSDAHIPEVLGCVTTKIRKSPHINTCSQESIFKQIKNGHAVPIGRTSSLSEKLTKEWRRMKKRF